MNIKTYNISRLLIVSLIILAAAPTLANQSAYNQGLEVSKQQKQDAMSALKSFDPKSLPEYTASPNAAKYYGGVTIKIDELSRLTKSDAAKTRPAQDIIESFSKHPTYKIDKNSPEMQKSQVIINNAQDIARGKSNKNVNCKTTKGIVCGEEFFCINGDCSKHEYELSKYFEKSVSMLAAIGAVPRDFDEKFIFRGKRLTCDTKIFGYSNCCQDFGWGQDLHLASCSDEEKKLGIAKQKKLTIYLGEYCANGFLGVCLRHNKAYCSFQTKLARIVQHQGRKQQLRISFGSAEHSNCRGITPEELQRIDFSQIDFREIYADVHSKMQLPDIDTTQKRIAERIKQQYSQ